LRRILAEREKREVIFPLRGITEESGFTVLSVYAAVFRRAERAERPRTSETMASTVVMAMILATMMSLLTVRRLRRRTPRIERVVRAENSWSGEVSQDKGS
jgi:hypothetical protein